MIKLETHCHTYLTSSCADNDDNDTIESYIKAGYGGIVATNHFCKSGYDHYFKGQTHSEKIKAFFDFIDEFKNKCRAKGLKCFWGAEIRSTVDGQEYMIIGLPKEVYFSEPCIYTYSQKQLFELAERHGAFMYQTHPFRDGVKVGDPKFLHGAEYFNGHYHHFNHNEKAEQFVTDNNLVGLSGTDFHHHGQPITAGIYIPEDVKDEKDYAKFLFLNDFKIVQDKETYQRELKKHKGIE